MKKYKVILELDNKQATKILAGLNMLVDSDCKVVKDYPHLEKDDALYKHMHEVTELREYFRERFIEAEEIPDENNAEN